VAQILSIASKLRDVTGRKRAEEELRTRERFLECLSEVSQQLLRADDLAEELPAILRRLGETAGVCRTYLFENYSGPKGELLCSQRYEWCAPGVEPQIDKPEQHNSPYVAGGFARWMEILGRGAVIAGATADLPESERAILESQGIRSVLVIPLFVSGTWYGFIGFDVCDQVREWQQVEIDLLRAAAGDIASTIEREQASRQAQALAEAAAALTATLDLEQVLDRILEQVGRVVSNDAANVMLIEGDQARVVRWRGYERFGSEELISAIVFRVSEVPNLQQMVESGEPMVIIDTAAYPGWAQVPTQEWLRSYAAAPIVVRGEVIGFLNVDSATPGFFTQAHIVPLRAFADYAAAAIENARLFEAANQRVAELEAVRQASLSLTSSLELPLVLEAILEHALQLVSADDAHIFLYNAGRLTFGAALWAGGRQQEPYAEPRPDGLTYTVAHSGERVVVSDMNDHPLFQGGQWAGAIVGLPLRVGGQVHGVMNVAYEKPHVFSENELGVLELLADHAAIAIENARLFDDLTHEKKRLELLYGLARALTEQIVCTSLPPRAARPRAWNRWTGRSACVSDAAWPAGWLLNSAPLSSPTCLRTSIGLPWMAWMTGCARR
jgi:GAF domain-containing protein